MPRTGRPKKPLVLTDDERQTLERWARRPKSAQALALRARIVLACAEAGATNQMVAAGLGVHPVTVGKWRDRFITKRLEGLSDEPRPGSPRTVTDDHVEAVVVKTLEETPTDATHWSTRSMAKATGMSQSAVSRIWRAFGLKPHLVDTFKLSSDPQFIEKVRDVVGLYMNPPDHAVVLAVDEKTQVQALDRTQPSLPMTKGRAGTMTHDYKRHGTTNLFAAMNVATGEILYDTRKRHTANDVLAFFKLIDLHVPKDQEIHVVLDNLSAHKAPPVAEWLAHPKRARWHLHFTPTSSSWLNQVEGWFSLLTKRRLQRGVFSSVDALIEAIETWAEHWNDDPHPFVWTKTAEAILAKARRARVALNASAIAATHH